MHHLPQDILNIIRSYLMISEQDVKENHISLIISLKMHFHYCCFCDIDGVRDTIKPFSFFVSVDYKEFFKYYKPRFSSFNP